MRVHYHNWSTSFWIASSTFLTFTLAASIPLPNSPNAIFALNPIFNGPNLDENSLLISSVQLLAREALEDITSQVSRTFYHSTDHRYASVGIFVMPPSNAPTLLRRLLVWGIAESLQCLIQLNRFASVEFRMTIDGINVGSVQYRLLTNDDRTPLVAEKAGLPRIERPITSSVTAGPMNATHGVSNGSTYDSTNFTLAANAEGLKVYFRLVGYDLETADVFRPVITLLRNIAEFSPQSRIVEFKTPFKIGDPALEFRARGPYFNAEALIKAAAAVPAYMLNKGRFSEVEIRIEMADVLIAKGQLKIQRTPPPGANAVNTSVS